MRYVMPIILCLTVCAKLAGAGETNYVFYVAMPAKDVVAAYATQAPPASAGPGRITLCVTREQFEGGEVKSLSAAEFDGAAALAREKMANYDTWPDGKMKAVIRLLVKEINTLRAELGLPPRTAQQVKNALHDELE